MELGSDFELDVSKLNYCNDHIFSYLEPYHTLYMDSGRSAAKLLNTMIPEGVILLPSYICDSVISVYRERFAIRFYKVHKNFMIDWGDMESKLDNQVTAVYLMHYFGQLQSEEFLKKLDKKKQEYGFLIIEDTTHSIFTKSKTLGDYCICSLRKWFPVMDGGVLYAEQSLDEISLAGIQKKRPSAKLEAMILKKLYLEGQLECNAVYRKIFGEVEEKLNMQKNVYQMSDISKAMLCCFSISEIKRKRMENYENIAEFISKNDLESALNGKGFVPLVYPIYIEDRDRFRKVMEQNRIYCALHWPIKGTELEKNYDAEIIYRNLISLPIDQRYDKEHMAYMKEQIECYLEMRSH